MPQLLEINNKMDLIWQVAPMDSYHPPPAPMRDVATEGIIKFWRLFRKSEIRPNVPEKKMEELERISLPLLSEIISAIDWNSNAEALGTHLNRCLNNRNQKGVLA